MRPFVVRSRVPGTSSQHPVTRAPWLATQYDQVGRCCSDVGRTEPITVPNSQDYPVQAVRWSSPLLYFGQETWGDGGIGRRACLRSMYRKV